MEIRQIRYFVEVAEALHFGKAAEKVSISQPALSQQIKLLEQHLGVELLDVSARKIYRKVKLTAAGEFFYNEAKKLLNIATKLEVNTKRFSTQKKTLKLGVYKALLKERIVEFIAHFAAENPQTEIVISEYENYVEVQEAILNGHIDKGLTLLPMVNQVLQYTTIKTGSLAVIMAQNNTFARENVSLNDLLQHGKWIELNKNVHPLYKEIEDCCKKIGITRQVVQEVSSLNLLISLVSLNNGIAFAPSLFDFKSEPNIVVKPLTEPPFNALKICHVIAEL